MMMKRKMAVAVCVVASACGVTGVASASASEFVFSKTGALKGSALDAQKFESAAGKWTCKKAKLSGSVTALKTATQKVTVQYEECVYFGLFLKATPVEYELNTNGTYKMLKALTMTGIACEITFPAQTASTLTYANKPAGKIEIAAGVTKLSSSGSGAACSYAEEHNTLLGGHSLLELEGGTAEVK